MEGKNVNTETEQNKPKFWKQKTELCLPKFKEFILDNMNNLPLLKQKLSSLAINSSLGKGLLRPFAWKLFLKSLSFSNTTTLREWLEQTQKQREEYKKKLSEINSKFEEDEKNQKDNKTKFSNFEEKSSIKHLISLDVERTYSEISLFQDKDIRKIEEDILYVFSQENKPTSYKQGMNEILALILYALFPYYMPSSVNSYSKNDFDQWCSNPAEYVNQIYAFFHDENEFQSDLYYLMYNIMNMGLNKFYDDEIDQERKNEEKKTYLLNRCDDILDKLRKHNIKLYEHFIEIKLSAEVVLQRWLKCVFSREFTPEDCIVIWDNILGNEFNIPTKNLEYIDYFCVAMFDYVSDNLMKQDQNECLLCLFKYPPFQTIKELIQLAEVSKANVLKAGKTSIFSSLKNKWSSFKFSDLIPNNPLSSNNSNNKEEEKKEKITKEINDIKDNKTRVMQLKQILNKYKGKFNGDDKLKIDLILLSLEKNV